MVSGRLVTRDQTRWFRINASQTAMMDVSRQDSGLRHHELSRNKSPRCVEDHFETFERVYEERFERGVYLPYRGP